MLYAKIPSPQSFGSVHFSKRESEVEEITLNEGTTSGDEDGVVQSVISLKRPGPAVLIACTLREYLVAGLNERSSQDVEGPV